MQHSTDRILTTHVGSLPRPPDLLDMMQAKEEGRAFDAQAHAARLTGAVAEIVRKQVELGIDIIDDGEYGKPSFVTYMNERLGGFEPAKGTAARAAIGCNRAKRCRFRNSTTPSDWGHGSPTT
jgi:5-methyltetrahydropteroyltriglutamate--homocysteine methyltransferase